MHFASCLRRTTNTKKNPCRHASGHPPARTSAFGRKADIQSAQTECRLRFQRQTFCQTDKKCLSSLYYCASALFQKTLKRAAAYTKLHGGFMTSARKTDRVRDIVTFGILGLFGLIVALLLPTLIQRDPKSEVAVAKDHARDTNDKLTNLESEVSQIRQDQSSARSALARLESQISAIPQGSSPISGPAPTPNNAWRITLAENKLVREFLEKVNGLDPIVEAGYKVGDKNSQ